MNDIATLPIEDAEKLQRAIRKLQPEQFRLEPFDKIEIGSGPEYLVRDILPLRGLIVIIGEPGCGKSFLASDLGLSLAQGKDWGGKQVQPGAVVYITAEGATGFRKRLVAYRQHHRIVDSVPFYLIADAPNLGSANGDAQGLIARISQQLGGEKIRLIVIDTLARTMHGADENNIGMSEFVKNCEQIERAFECAILAVHHVGKDATRGGRGNSCLKGAADLEILVEGTDGERTASITKSKDGESGLSLSFNLERVEINGAMEVSSCIVQPLAGWQHSVTKRTKNVTGSAKIVLGALQLAIEEAGEEAPTGGRLNRTKRVVRTSLWRKYADKVQISEADTPDAKRKAFTRASASLQNIGKVTVWDDWVCIND